MIQTRVGDQLVGKTIGGRFTLVRPIGEGGMGVVYEATTVGSSRTVAVKILFSKRAANETAVKRFFREAKAVASLSSPQICKIFDIGQLESGEPYFVMEHLVGETLRTRLDRQRSVSVAEAVGIVAQILSALSAAHQKGIVHRDVKPENIFLVRGPDGSGMVKLIDFGVAKFSRGDDEAVLTKKGTVVGTMWYVAPEQARALPDVDERIDVWATGVIFYELLTGVRPFDADKLSDLLMQILEGDYVPLRNFNPSVPTQIENILSKALAVEPENRYRNAAMFQAALLTGWSAAQATTVKGTSRPTSREPSPSSRQPPSASSRANPTRGGVPLRTATSLTAAGPPPTPLSALPPQASSRGSKGRTSELPTAADEDEELEKTAPRDSGQKRSAPASTQNPHFHVPTLQHADHRAVPSSRATPSRRLDTETNLRPLLTPDEDDGDTTEVSSRPDFPEE